MQSSFSTTTLKLIFYRYKDTVYYPVVNVGILFVIGAFLLFQVVIPQFSQWFSVQREVDTIKQDIKIMQDNITFLSSLDESALDADLKTVTNAYPFQKDYAGIIDALTNTSSKTGVALPDFRISVGESQSGDLPAAYQMAFTLDASLEVTKLFISELNQVLPIAAVTSIDNTGGSTTVSLEFYYHGFPTIAINQKEKLKTLSASERELLARLKTWQGAVQEEAEVIADIEDTSSASGAFPPPF